MHCMPSLSASALCRLFSFFFFQNIPLHFTFITAICPSEFSPDTDTPGSFPASYPQCRTGASAECSSLLTSSFQLHSGRRSEGGSRVRSAYLFPTPYLLGHCRLTVSSIHSPSSCRAMLCIQPLTGLFNFLFNQRGVVPPPGFWPRSTKVPFLHHAHIWVNSTFINSLQLPSWRCPCFLL